MLEGGKQGNLGVGRWETRKSRCWKTMEYRCWKVGNKEIYVLQGGKQGNLVVGNKEI